MAGQARLPGSAADIASNGAMYSVAYPCSSRQEALCATEMSCACEWPIWSSRRPSSPASSSAWPNRPSMVAATMSHIAASRMNSGWPATSASVFISCAVCTAAECLPFSNCAASWIRSPSSVSAGSPSSAPILRISPATVSESPTSPGPSSAQHRCSRTVASVRRSWLPRAIATERSLSSSRSG